jgi:hypothetical protein
MRPWPPVRCFHQEVKGLHEPRSVSENKIGRSGFSRDSAPDLNQFP